MVLRRLVPLVALVVTLAVPAAVPAAVVQTIPLDSAGNGIAVGIGGEVHVVEPFANEDQIFTPQGALFGTVAIPAGAASATRGPDGMVWIATGSGLVRIQNDTTAVPFATGLGCPPVAVASQSSGGVGSSDAIVYSAPANGAACGTHGLGALPAGGGAGFTDATIPDAFDLAIDGEGQLFAPVPSVNRINRYNYGGAFTLQASIAVPANSGPEGVAVGLDGKVYVTLFDSGQVARFPADAPNGTDATIVASGLQHPFGIAAGPRGDVTIASHDDGRLVQVGPPGVPHDVALPAGFKPQQVAVSGDDVWVTDSDAARVARVVDGAPFAFANGVPSLSAGLPLSIDSHGNATHWTLTAQKDGTLAGVADGDVAAAIDPTAVTADLSGLPNAFGGACHGASGHYDLTLTASNMRGSVTEPAGSLDVPPAPCPPPATVQPPVTKATPTPTAPKLATFVSLPSPKRCVATRSIRLTLRKAKKGAPTVTKLKVTVGKHQAKSYTSKQLRKALKLTGLPKAGGKVKVKVVATLSNRTTVTQTLTYTVCASKHPKAKGKKHR